MSKEKSDDAHAVDMDRAREVVAKLACERFVGHSGKMPDLLAAIITDPGSVVRFIFEIGREYERRWPR